MDDFTPLNLFGDEKASDENSSETVVEEVKEEGANAEAKVEANADETATKKVDEKNDETVDEVSEEKKDEVIDEVVDEVVDENLENNTDTSPEEEPKPDKLDELVETQKKLLESIDSLNNLFNARIMHTDHEEKIVDQMHKELQKYKEDMYAQLVRPILLDVIEVRDSIMRMAATYLAKPEGEQNIPNKTFSDYAYDLQDILEKNSVEIYRSKSGDDFTPIKQRVVKKVTTADESLHGKVAESLSCGYSYKERTISAEKITVYCYEKPVEKENENSEVIENG